MNRTTTHDRLTKAARKIHPECVVEIGMDGLIEVLLPEGCGLLWSATEGTMLVAHPDRFGDSFTQAVREVLADIKLGVYSCSTN